MLLISVRDVEVSGRFFSATSNHSLGALCPPGQEAYGCRHPLEVQIWFVMTLAETLVHEALNQRRVTEDLFRWGL